MSGKIRFAFVFLVGLILVAWGWLLTGAGHGTYIPLVGTLVLAPIPVVVIPGTPFLWAIYYTVIPAIDSRWQPITVISLILLLHLVPVVWLARDDPAFARYSQRNPALVVIDGLALCVAFIFLVLLCSKGNAPAEVS